MNRFLLLIIFIVALVFSLSCGNNSSTSILNSDDTDDYQVDVETEADVDVYVSLDEDVQTEGGLGLPCRADKGCDKGLICTDELECVSDASEPVKKDLDNMAMWTGKVFFPEGISFKYEAESKSVADDADDTIYANYFCENLSYGSYDDWRLPSITELRRLVVGCDKTVTDGACNVGTEYEDGNSCLGYKCGQEDCNDVCQYRSSEVGTGGCYWSGFSCPENWQSIVWSSTFYQMSGGSTQYSWTIIFSEGSILGKSIYVEKASLLCVRDITEEELEPSDADGDINDEDISVDDVDEVTDDDISVASDDD